MSEQKLSMRREGRLRRTQHCRVQKLKFMGKVFPCRNLVLLVLWNIWLESFNSSCSVTLVHENMARKVRLSFHCQVHG